MVAKQVWLHFCRLGDKDQQEEDDKKTQTHVMQLTKESNDVMDSSAEGFMVYQHWSAIYIVLLVGHEIMRSNVLVVEMWFRCRTACWMSVVWKWGRPKADMSK